MRNRQQTEKLWLKVAVLFLLSGLLSPEPASAQLFGGGGLFGRKDKEEPLGPPKDPGIPSPISDEVEILKGSETTFSIRAQVSNPAALVEFLIRDFPQAGKIVSLVRDPNNRGQALVTYLAEKGTPATTDAFTFAARYRGGRYSPIARIDVKLVGTRSDIEVTDELDFGEVTIGDELEKTILVQNGSDTPFLRQIMLNSPWHITSPENGKLQIPPFGAREITVAFRPTLEGEAKYMLPVSRSSKGLCKMRGVGIVPFSVGSEEVTLTFDPRTRTRSGEIVLRNESSKPFLLNVRGSSRLSKSLETEVIMPPEMENRKKVALAESDVAAFQGSVEFYLENGFSKIVRVSAGAVPGELKVEIPDSLSGDVLNFGQVKAGRSTERGVLVKNIGGEPIPVEIQVTEPYRILSKPPAQLPPLSSAQVAVGFTPLPGDVGMADVTMKVVAGEQVHTVRLLGNVLRSKNTPRFSMSRSGSGESETENSTGQESDKPVVAEKSNPDSPPERPAEENVSTPGGKPLRLNTQNVPPGNMQTVNPDLLDENWRTKKSPEELLRSKTNMGFETLSLLVRRTDPDMRGAEDLEVVSTSAKTVTLGWTAPPDSKFHEFEVESAGMMQPMGEDGTRGMARSAWIPCKDVEFQRIGRLVKAKVKVRSPGTSYEFRVITTDQRGMSATPSESIVARTDLPLDWTWIYVGCSVVVIILLSVALRKVYLYRRGEVYQSQYVDS